MPDQEEYRRTEEVHTTTGDTVPGTSYMETERSSFWYSRKALWYLLAVALSGVLIFAMILIFKRPANQKAKQEKTPLQQMMEYVASMEQKITPSEERDLGLNMVKNSRERDKTIEINEEELKFIGVTAVKRCPQDRPAVHLAKKSHPARVKKTPVDLESYYSKVSSKSCSPPFCP